MEQSKFYQIKNVTEQEYTLVSCDGSVITRPIQDVDKSASAFTIQDAKDGDVLTCYSDIKRQPIEQTGIIKQYVGRHGGCSNSFKAHFGVDWDNNVVIEGYMGSSNIYPATKEQRDTLMKAMTEAGYTFDFEKKELKKIVDEEQIKKNLQDNSFRRMFEQNTSWSEKGEDYINDLIKYFSQNERLKNTKEDIVIWLKSLRPQNMRSYNPYKAVVESIAEMCEKYKGYVCAKEVANDFFNKVFAKCHEAIEYDKKYPQRQWKPSKEQMEALWNVYEGGEKQSSLASLYNDLKKLKD